MGILQHSEPSRPRESYRKLTVSFAAGGFLCWTKPQSRQSLEEAISESSVNSEFGFTFPERFFVPIGQGSRSSCFI